MIDLHCHILPGIDDGPATIEETLELARAAVAGGTRTIVATSHVSPRYPNDPATIALGVGQVNARLAEEKIPLEVRAGAEVAISMIDELGAEDLRALRLGGGPWLLIESPFTLVVDSLPAVVGYFQSAGHEIVLAHPERCPGFHRRPELLKVLVREQKVLTSVTAGSLVGQFGRDVERFALGMARAGLIHNVASDAHDTERRPPVIADRLEQAGLGAYAELLVKTMPRAILDGTDLPLHPGAMLDPPRRRWWRRREPDIWTSG
ncbi:MAG: protein-tyrosine phosphatase [Solirubrobacteraceae bacterium]|nr:protein-tyrosine phosphatase [Solirubrobacteraceae bacterium]